MMEVLILAFGIVAFANSGALLHYAMKQPMKWPWVAFSMMMGAIGILCIFRLLGRSLFFYPESGNPGESVILFTVFPMAWLIALIVLARSIGKERLEKRVERLRTLNEIALRFQHEIASKDIPELIVAQLNRLISFESATMFLYDDRRRAIYPVFEKRVDPRFIEKDKPISITQGGELREIMNGKPKLLAHSIMKNHQRDPIGKTQRGESILAVPLLVIDRPVGMIEIRRSEAEGYSNEEIDIVSLLAQQAAIIFENSRLLGEMEREKDTSRQYLDLLSHDIANLNTPMYSYFDMMLDDSKLNDDSKHVVNKVYRQVHKIGSLVTRVRRLSMAETKDAQGPIACNPLRKLETAMNSLRTTFPEKKMIIDVDKATEPESVIAGEILDEIFFNILNNSVKYSKEDGARIEISFQRMEIDGRKLSTIKICDHGTGVPDDLKERIFTRRKDAAASYARGFDLDLYTCRKYIESWEGNIWVEDRVKGRSSEGACFVISLPVSISL